MNVKDFIEETLTQICEGVFSAQGKASACGAVINPFGLRTVSEKGQFMPTARQTEVLTSVDFDLALVATEESEKSGKGGIGIRVLNIGGEMSSSTISQATHRIRFSVPVVLPHQRGD